MLRRFVLPDKDDWNIPPVPFLQHHVFINIHFVQHRAELAQQRRDGRFRFIAKMATRTRIQSHVARPAAGKAQLFR